MLQFIKLISFKGITKKEIYFGNEINSIIGENGIGKTNILEGIGILFGSHLLNKHIDQCVQKGENMFFIEGNFVHQNISQTIQLSYDKQLRKKIILLNGKKTTKKNIIQNTPIITTFLPFMMNLFYLGPKYRRDFLDDIVSKVFPEQSEILEKYEKIIKNRNKILKNISEKLSSIDELAFWDQQLIEYAKIIYEKRIHCIDFINSQLGKYSEIFGWKVENIVFEYKTKTNLKNIGDSMQKYFQENLQRDIILAKTNIGPHLDDFDILLDNMSIHTYASRGETKSIIIVLKLIEGEYIKKYRNTSYILLIDDLMSELDIKHTNTLLKWVGNHQVILTNIQDIGEVPGTKIFI